MRKKSRPFSIYLLKTDFNANNSLKEDSELLHIENAVNLPENSTLYILDSDPNPPWWRNYFGIRIDLRQVTKGALLFLNVGDRCFALSFGHVLHHLKDVAYEYDFGLRVTLNSLDPNELKSADMVEPGPARRKRTQVPIATELTYLDFDSNSEIIKSLTGKVKKEYEGLFKNATGSTSLKISLNLQPNELADICTTLLELYGSKEYKETFPNIQNVEPVKHPNEISILNEELLDAFKNKAENLYLSIPDIIDYRDNTCCIFQGSFGKSDVYPDISLEAFFESQGEKFEYEQINLEQLRSYKLLLTDADGNIGKGYSLYRCFVFDTPVNSDGVLHHLCEGNWYKVEQSYAALLKMYLDAKCEDTDLIPYNHDAIKDEKKIYSEAEYNKAIPIWDDSFICLDQTDISPKGQTNVEPCDLYSAIDVGDKKLAKLYHVKISTRSASLSHLFNQGVNSTDLIELEADAREKMKELVKASLGSNDEETFLAPLDKFNFKIIYSIITRKDKDLRSDNLPLFSKISLMRVMRMLDVRKIEAALCFIDDQSEEKKSHKKQPQLIVEIIDIGNKKNVVRAIPDQECDTSADIKRVPQIVRDAPAGSRFKIGVKINEDGSINSHHTWSFEEIVE